MRQSRQTFLFVFNLISTEDKKNCDIKKVSLSVNDDLDFFLGSAHIVQQTVIYSRLERSGESNLRSEIFSRVSSAAETMKTIVSTAIIGRREVH